MNTQPFGTLQNFSMFQLFLTIPEISSWFVFDKNEKHLSDPIFSNIQKLVEHLIIQPYIINPVTLRDQFSKHKINNINDLLKYLEQNISIDIKKRDQYVSSQIIRRYIHVIQQLNELQNDSNSLKSISDSLYREYHDIRSNHLDEILLNASHIIWENIRDRYINIIDVSYGQILHERTCSKCSNKSYDFSNFRTIRLPTSADGHLRTSISNWLELSRNNTDENELPADCSNCHHDKYIGKQSLWRIPPVLIFEYSGGNVSMPFRLILNEYISKFVNTGELKYELFGYYGKKSITGDDFTVVCRDGSNWFKHLHTGTCFEIKKENETIIDNALVIVYRHQLV